MSLSTKILVSLALFIGFAHSAVNFPYPQQKSYGNSTINTTNSNASASLKSKFTSFLSSHYEESGNLARIKFDNTSQTVSEGVAYGMLMMVYFSDNTTSYQSNFDKLWAYYQKWTNNNDNLMHWKINGFNSVVEEGAASDAEVDAAVALVMAHYQFGSTSSKNYLDTAKVLISKIRQYELSANNLLKPGNRWENKRNPSYVSPAAFEIFKEVETLQTAKDKWGSVVTANYTMLKANQNSSSGLFSDWCNDNGSHNSGDYGYDAARTPWRLAWANAWYGHADAKTMLTNLYSRFLNSKNAGDIGGSISLTGSMGGQKNSTFVGPFMNALSYSSSNQTKMNDYWTTLMAFNNELYYSKALQILTGLLASGNMPNLKSSTPSTTPSSSSGGSVSGVQIDQFATATGDDKGYAKTWEAWYAYTDVGNSGTSNMQNTKSRALIWNKETSKCEESDSYVVIMQDGSDWVAKIDRYTLNQGGNENEPYVALGLDAVNNGTTGSTGYNFSGCTGGFAYSYKGEAHNFKAQLKTIEDYAYHYMEIVPASATWKTVTVPISELVQPSWTKTKVTFSLSAINAFSWELKGDAKNAQGNTITGVSAKTGSLAIKDFKCVGTMTFPSSRPAPKCGSGSSSSSNRSSSSVNSSSSNRSSSSVNSSSSRGSSSSGINSSSSRGSSSSVSSSSGSVVGVSSSSGGAVAVSSSSYGNIDQNPSSSSNNNISPIAISKIANANSSTLISNGVSLQVKNNAALEVFNINGNSIRKMNFSSGTHSVKFQDLPKGLYIVKVRYGNSGAEIIKMPIR
jgi:endo-1,4-beta-D-glucanase Y